MRERVEVVVCSFCGRDASLQGSLFEEVLGLLFEYLAIESDEGESTVIEARFDAQHDSGARRYIGVLSELTKGRVGLIAKGFQDLCDSLMREEVVVLVVELGVKGSGFETGEEVVEEVVVGDET